MMTEPYFLGEIGKHHNNLNEAKMHQNGTEQGAEFQ